MMVWVWYLFFFSNDSTALLRAFVVVSAVKNVFVFLCSPEGFDFSHICLYVCVLWLVAVIAALTHTRFAQWLLCLRERDLFFFQGKRSFRYKNIIFCDIFQFLQFDPLVCCEWVLVKPITYLCVSVLPKTRPKNEVRVPVLVKRCASKS